MLGLRYGVASRLNFRCVLLRPMSRPREGVFAIRAPCLDVSRLRTGRGPDRFCAHIFIKAVLITQYACDTGQIGICLKTGPAGVKSWR